MSATVGLPRAYWQLWSGATATSLGDGIRMAAFPLLAASLTSSATQISLVTVATYLPALLVGPFAGVLVDRAGKRSLILAANLGRAAVLLGLTVLITLGAASIPLLGVFAFLYGAGEALEDPASHAILPRLVGTDRLGSANSRLQTGQVLAEMFIGRGLGGTLFALTAWTPILSNVLLLLLAAGFVSALPKEPAPTLPPPGTTSVWRDLRAGIATVIGSRLLSLMSILVACWSIASGAFWGIGAVYVLDTLHSGPRGYGLMLAFSGIGALAGAALAVRTVRRIGAGIGSVVALVLSAGSMLTLGLTHNLVVAALCIAVNGFGVTVWNVVSATVRQANVPLDLLGRTSSAYRILATVTMPAGAAAAGVLASTAGAPAALIAANALLAIAGCAVLPLLAPILSQSWPTGQTSATALTTTHPPR